MKLYSEIVKNITSTLWTVEAGRPLADGFNNITVFSNELKEKYLDKKLNITLKKLIKDSDITQNVYYNCVSIPILFKRLI